MRLVIGCACSVATLVLHVRVAPRCCLFPFPIHCNPPATRLHLHLFFVTIASRNAAVVAAAAPPMKML